MERTENKKTEDIKQHLPIKEFLLKRSLLVKFNEKEAKGQELNKAEKAKQDRIYKYRDEVFVRIRKEVQKYYEKVIQGNYLYDGMPEIGRGIRGWIEDKL